jgi:hypothetical protein
MKIRLDHWRGALELNLIQTVRMMRLAMAHISNGSPRHCRGGCGCDRVHRPAARLLDQWLKYSG